MTISKAAAQRACDLVNALDDTEWTVEEVMSGDYKPMTALATHLQQVSDAASSVRAGNGGIHEGFMPFILPDEPDRLEQALGGFSKFNREVIRKAIEAAGGRIVWEEQG